MVKCNFTRTSDRITQRKEYITDLYSPYILDADHRQFLFFLFFFIIIILLIRLNRVSIHLRIWLVC